MKRLVVKRKAEVPRGSWLFLCPLGSFRRLSALGEGIAQLLQAYVVCAYTADGDGGAPAGAPRGGMEIPARESSQQHRGRDGISRACDIHDLAGVGREEDGFILASAESRHAVRPEGQEHLVM